MFEKVVKMIIKKQRIILMIVIFAVFPLIRMNVYFENNSMWRDAVSSDIALLKEDAIKAQTVDFDYNIKSNEQVKLTNLFNSIIAMEEAYQFKDYDKAAILFNEVALMLESFQNSVELRAYLNDNFRVRSLSKFEIHENYNILNLDNKKPSSASLFGFVGAFDYFYYFYTHNTYFIWAFIILFSFDYLTRIKKSNEDKINTVKAFKDEWCKVIASYMIGLAIFLVLLILFKGVGNVERGISYFSLSMNQPLRFPSYLFVLAQMFFHFLNFGVVLALITIFSKKFDNKYLSLVLTIVTCGLLYMMITSSFGSFSPFTYGDLLSNIHSGTNYHFLDPNNKLLIKDTGTLMKGLSVNIGLIVVLLGLTLRSNLKTKNV
ncbi:MAG: hypothetical protein VB009_01200 [Erysipelotrichaceae bacterium]|nr:hypothetical protein [Erysipelotrichaceae bacterium]